MRHARVLFLDNDVDFLETRAESLRQAGYQVLAVSDLSEAQRKLEGGGFDVAVLDIRVLDDNDDKDLTGLTLARETARSMPKIVLTDFPTPEIVRMAMRPEFDGLPAAVEFVAKQEGAGALIEALQRAVGVDTQWLRNVKYAVAGTNLELKAEYDDAQQQSRWNYRASLLVAFLGIGIIFAGVVLALSNNDKVGIATTISGLVTEAVSYLFFRRVDVANKRMDRYHRERVEIRRFEILLQSCDGLESEQKQERCRERLIIDASAGWLSSVHGKPTTEPRADSDQAGKE